MTTKPNRWPDRVTVVKVDGRRYIDIPAVMEDDEIITVNATCLVIPSDTLEVELSDGSLDHYVVLEAQYWKKTKIEPACYELTVKKVKGR